MYILIYSCLTQLLVVNIITKDNIIHVTYYLDNEILDVLSCIMKHTAYIIIDNETFRMY